MDTVFGLPLWSGYLLVGMLGGYSLFLAGLTVVRTGHHVLWTLLLVVPVLNIVAVWLLAYRRWPRLDGPGPDTDGTSVRPGA